MKKTKAFNNWFMNSDLPGSAIEAAWVAWCAWHDYMENN